jgi:hypothetical protein
MIRFRLMWIFYALVYSACLLYLHSNRISFHSKEITQQGHPAIINHNYAASAQKNA